MTIPWISLYPPMILLAICLSLLPSSHQVIRLPEENLIDAAEVSVSINPANPSNIIAASMAKSPRGRPRVTNYLYVSRDAGMSWKTVAAPNPDGRVQGDDAVTFNSSGIAYHSYISFDGLREPRPVRAANGIFVSSSSDGGLTWDNPVAVVDHRNTVTPFEDKPYLVTDNSATSAYKHNIYIAWTRFDVYGSPDPNDHSNIYFSRSSDGGKSYSAPVRISDTQGDCLDSDNTVEGAVPSVGPHGEVYVVWAGPAGLVFDASLDGGVTFGKDRVIAQNPGGWDIPTDGLTRHNGMPVTGVDHSSGPHRGSVYVNWIDERYGDPDVFLMYSRDGGETWSAPVRVNDDPLRNGKAQLFSWMAIDPVDGSVNVVFYDRRDHERTRTSLTLARSVDGGRTFVNHKIDQPSFLCNEKVFFGDYSGISAYSGLVVPAYAHFISDHAITVSAALFRFDPGTQDTIPNGGKS